VIYPRRLRKWETTAINITMSATSPMAMYGVRADRSSWLIPDAPAWGGGLVRLPLAIGVGVAGTPCGAAPVSE
jgi:hypothetical protein